MHLAGLISRPLFCVQSHVATRELWRFMFGFRGVAILISSAKSFECIWEVVHEKEKHEWAYHGAFRVYVKAVDVSHSNEQG